MTAVLLAEDDEAIAAPLSRALGREGYDVTVEQTGPAALQQALEGAYDLLILDLGLPGM
ncbi:MAG: response regulator, partial [Rhodococcus sp. (in: high G+C Gram-positive bacteria)]